MADTRVRRRDPLLLKLTLVAAGVLAAVVTVEVGARVVIGNWTESFLERSVPLVPTSVSIAGT